MFSAPSIIVNGSEYHLWFVYTLTGIYLFLPFLKRILDSCSEKERIWLLLFVLFPTTLRPFFNTVTPAYVYLFDPLMEGYLGYLILGYILGTTEFSKRKRMIFYAGGIAGFLIAVIGNRQASSSEGINLVFNGGYQLNHYLCASAVFVLAKQFPKMKAGWAVRFLSTYSGATYGIYLMHVLICDLTRINLLPRLTGLTPFQEIIVLFMVTSLVSSCTMLLLSKVKYINKLLL